MGVVMGAGFTWMDSSLKRCGSERIGREEEWTSSGRADLGGYAGILKHTPDTQDLVTATGSEVLCRLVRRWIGIKAYRDEPLNEKEDDLMDEGITLVKAGDSYQWIDRYYDRAAHQWKKDT
jgi:hypothetical protein